MHTLALALVAALALTACAPKKAPKPDVSARGLSATAASDYYYLLYQDLARQGQPAAAGTILEQLIKIAPSPDFYRDLANIQWGQGQADKARETLEEGLKRFPDEIILHFYLANSYVLQRRYDDAEAVFRTFLARHPNDQAATQDLAAVLLESGKHQAALDLLASVPKDRRTPVMTFNESKAYSGLGKRKLAQDKLRQALKEDPNLLPAWSELAFTYEQAGDYRQAEAAYRRILDLGEDGPEVWLRLIRLALKQKNMDKALALLDNAPRDRNFLFDALSLFVDEGREDGAARVIERMSQEQPDNPDVIFIQAMMAVDKEKNLDKAMALLAKVPPTSKLYDKSLSSRVQLALDTGRFDLALPLIQEGKARFPDKLDFLLMEAVYYDKQGDVARATAIYKDGLNRWPDNVELLYRYGVGQERLKNRAEALAAMERILVLDPANADALNFVGYTLAEDGKDLDRALDLVTRALSSAPENPYYIDSLAWVHFKRGDLNKAWAEIQRATSRELEDPAVWEHYGDIAKAMGNRKDAAKGYRKALEMKSPNAAEIQRKLDALK